MAWPYSFASSSSGTNPFSIIDGVPHSLLISVFWLRCHQASYAKYCGPRSVSHCRSTSNVP